ncbi:MAG: ribosome hibernation-promoting factor, HPF/YfiA family [Bradymonadia bacterium]
MNLEMVGKEVTPSDNLRNRIEAKLGKIEQRVGHQLFARVVFGKDGKDYTCSVHFKSHHHDFSATANTNDLFKSADEAITKIERQVRKVLHKDEASRKPSASIRATVPEDLEA